jgi:hypothetical protein
MRRQLVSGLTTSIRRRIFMSARIRAGSCFKRFLCFVLIVLIFPNTPRDKCTPCWRPLLYTKLGVPQRSFWSYREEKNVSLLPGIEPGTSVFQPTCYSTLQLKLPSSSENNIFFLPKPDGVSLELTTSPKSPLRLVRLRVHIDSSCLQGQVLHTYTSDCSRLRGTADLSSERNWGGMFYTSPPRAAVRRDPRHICVQRSCLGSSGVVVADSRS